MNFEKQFTEIVSKCKKTLIDEPNIIKVQYAGIDYKAITEKNLREIYISNGNQFILKKLSVNDANIYALWIREKNKKKWQLRYVGERKSGQIHLRLREHLFYKHHKTGSKLEEVKKALENRCDIGVSVVSIQPDELRTAVEERITKEECKKEQLWNIQNQHKNN